MLPHGVAKNRLAVRGMIVEVSSFKIAILKSKKHTLAQVVEQENCLVLITREDGNSKS